jgi:hypothetical protein
MPASDSADAAYALAQRELPLLDESALSRSVLYIPGVGAGLLGTCTLIGALPLEVPATVVMGVGAVLAQERVMQQLARNLEEEIFDVSFAEQRHPGRRDRLTRSIALSIFKRRPAPQVGVFQSSSLRFDASAAALCHELASRYGVEPRAIQDIWERRSWILTTRPVSVVWGRLRM